MSCLLHFVMFNCHTRIFSPWDYRPGWVGVNKRKKKKIPSHLPSMSVCWHVLGCKNRNRSRIGFRFREALIDKQLCVSIITYQISFRHSWSRSCVGVLVSRAFLQHTHKPFEFSTRHPYTIPVWVERLRVKEDCANLISNGCVSTAVRLKRLKWHTGFNLSQRLKRLKWRYPFHPNVTAVAPKISRSFCQKCRWQVTAKHTYTLPKWLWMKRHCKLVHGSMVYTELEPRRQHFTWHQPYNNQRALPVHHFRGY